MDLEREKRTAQRRLLQGTHAGDSSEACAGLKSVSPPYAAALASSLYIASVFQRLGPGLGLPHTLCHGGLVMLLLGPAAHAELCQSGLRPPQGSAAQTPAAQDAYRPAVSCAGSACLSVLYTAMLAAVLRNTAAAGEVSHLHVRWASCLALGGMWPEALRRFLLSQTGRLPAEPDRRRGTT